MDCRLVRSELVLWHFGESERRAEIDAHLLECAACVRAFVSLKRGIETSDDRSPAPSERVRLKLRAAVAREISRPRRVRYAWAAALAAAILIVALSVSREAPRPEPSRGPAIDSSVPDSANLQIL